MPLVLADRVRETTTTTGQGTVTLAGAVSGFQSFSVIGNGNTTYYTIAGQGTNEWEVGIGTYTSSGTTLSRDTVLASSAGAPTKTNFSAGTKDVFVTYTAARSVNVDGTSIDTFGLGAAQGDILYASGTNNFVLLNKNATATRYLANTGTTNNPQWDQVNLANGVTGTLPIANGGTGETSRQAAMDALAGAVTSGQYLRGNGTDVVMSAIQAADVPTLNQNTTGNAATATTATNQSGGTVNATTMVSSGRYTRNTTGGINSPSARFALTTSQQADYHIASSVNGSSPTNTQQYGITFSPSGGSTQAGILISENGSDGTAIGFFCTNSYATGPQLRGSFDPAGNFTAAANVTAYSDERYKTNWRSVTVNFVEKLAQVRSGIYDRTDEAVTQAGVSAQSWQEVLPETVLEDESGRLSVAYGNAALVACVELAKEVMKLRAEIDALKARG